MTKCNTAGQCKIWFPLWAPRSLSGLALDGQQLHADNQETVLGLLSLLKARPMKEQGCLLLPIGKSSPGRIRSPLCPALADITVSVVAENTDDGSRPVSESRKGSGHLPLVETLINSSTSLCRNCEPSEKSRKEQREEGWRWPGRGETIDYKSASNSYSSREHGKDTTLNDRSWVKFSTKWHWPCQQQEVTGQRWCNWNLIKSCLFPRCFPKCLSLVVLSY